MTKIPAANNEGHAGLVSHPQPSRGDPSGPLGQGAPLLEPEAIFLDLGEPGGDADVELASLDDLRGLGEEHPSLLFSRLQSTASQEAGPQMRFEQRGSIQLSGSADISASTSHHSPRAQTSPLPEHTHREQHGKGGNRSAEKGILDQVRSWTFFCCARFFEAVHRATTNPGRLGRAVIGGAATPQHPQQKLSRHAAD
jgi:hypothetical protein